MGVFGKQFVLFPHAESSHRVYIGYAAGEFRTDV